MRRKKHKSIEKRKEYRKIRKLVRTGFEAQAKALEEHASQSNSLTDEQLEEMGKVVWERLEKQIEESKKS
ncbi:Uncharacterised protein [uncultured Clostridium sp.]|nr:Uncharacterised protein [uncultured Clostridium sp.]